MKLTRRPVLRHLSPNAGLGSSQILLSTIITVPCPLLLDIHVLKRNDEKKVTILENANAALHILIIRFSLFKRFVLMFVENKKDQRKRIACQRENAWQRVEALFSSGIVISGHVWENK